MKKVEKEKVRAQIEQTMREQILLDMLLLKKKIFRFLNANYWEYVFQVAVKLTVLSYTNLQNSNSEQMRMMVADITRNKIWAQFCVKQQLPILMVNQLI